MNRRHFIKCLPLAVTAAHATCLAAPAAAAQPVSLAFHPDAFTMVVAPLNLSEEFVRDVHSAEFHRHIAGVKSIGPITISGYWA